ncbi:MAG: acyl-CoA thioesterase [Solirubrobacteraceae bacterium]
MGEPFGYPLRVRYSECDMQGVVFNGHYLAYFDISMTELWRAAFGSYQAMTDRGVDLVVAEARVRYRAPARFDDQLRIEIAVASLGRTSVTTSHKVSREDTLIAEGEMRHVFVHATALTSTPVPDWARSGLEPWTL